MSRSPDTEKLRVLVVDDEPTLRLGFAYALSNRNTEVETAADGKQALQRLDSGDFDIVILDMRMPKIDGIDVVNSLRSRQDHIPIVLCCAAFSPNATLGAIRQGVVDFLLKPVKPSELREIVEWVVRPQSGALPQALKAARARQLGEAVRILEGCNGTDRRIEYWLGLFRYLRNPDSPELLAKAEAVYGCLPMLAFNAP